MNKRPYEFIVSTGRKGIKRIHDLSFFFFLGCFLDGSKKSLAESDAGSDVVEEEIAENGQEEQEKRYYDKSSSFFDRISCEALEKQEGYVHDMFSIFIRITTSSL